MTGEQEELFFQLFVVLHDFAYFACVYSVFTMFLYFSTPESEDSTMKTKPLGMTWPGDSLHTLPGKPFGSDRKKSRCGSQEKLGAVLKRAINSNQQISIPLDIHNVDIIR